MSLGFTGSPDAPLASAAWGQNQKQMMHDAVNHQRNQESSNPALILQPKP